MKKCSPRFIVLLCFCFFLVTVSFWQVRTTVFAEQSSTSPESGSSSRIKTAYDSLVVKALGTDSAGGWGNWGAYWNRIRSAAEWVPESTITESDVIFGKTFYANNRTIKTGSLTFVGDALESEVALGKTFYSNSLALQIGSASRAPDYSLQSLAYFDDARNGDASDGDVAGEEANWTNTAGTAQGGVWQDNRTGLFWSVLQGSSSNNFTVATCDFFSAVPRGSYGGGDADCGNAINACSTLSLDATGDGISETNWYLASEKELIQAFIDGIYNTNATFANGNYFWSSTENVANSATAFRVYLDIGVANNVRLKSNTNPYRCVRRNDT